MGICAHGLDSCVVAGAAIQFVSEVEVQPEARGKIGSRSVDLASRRNTAVGTVALNADKVVAVQPRTIEAEIGDIGGCVGGNIVPADHFVSQQGWCQLSGGISCCAASPASTGSV